MGGRWPGVWMGELPEQQLRRCQALRCAHAASMSPVTVAASLIMIRDAHLISDERALIPARIRLAARPRLCRMTLQAVAVRLKPRLCLARLHALRSARPLGRPKRSRPHPPQIRAHPNCNAGGKLAVLLDGCLCWLSRRGLDASSMGAAHGPAGVCRGSCPAGHCCLSSPTLAATSSRHTPGVRGECSGALLTQRPKGRHLHSEVQPFAHGTSNSAEVTRCSPGCQLQHIQPGRALMHCRHQCRIVVHRVPAAHNHEQTAAERQRPAGPTKWLGRRRKTYVMHARLMQLPGGAMRRHSGACAGQRQEE